MESACWLRRTWVFPRAGRWGWLVALIATGSGSLQCSRSGFTDSASKIPGSPSDPPTVTLTSPLDGLTVLGQTRTTLGADASDDVEVTEVEFFVNDASAGKATGVPYQVSWTPPCTSGGATYTIQARARDGQDQITSSSTVSVNTVDRDNDSEVDGCDSCDLTGVSLPLPSATRGGVYVQVTDFRLNGTGNVAQVTAGASVALDASQLWRSDACPNCITQLYYGLATVDNASQTEVCCINPQAAYPGGVTYSFSTSFVAPSSPGTYYVIASTGWDYVCRPTLPIYTSDQASVVGALCVQ